MHKYNCVVYFMFVLYVWTAVVEHVANVVFRFCEEDIDQILEQRAHVVQLESEGKGSTFSKASFVTDESSDINVDDPDFWQKWAEKAQLNLDELANKVCTVYTQCMPSRERLLRGRIL